MRELTKEEIEVIEKYDIQFKREEGFILSYDSSDIPVVSIIHFLINNHRMHILEGNDGRVFGNIHHNNMVYKERQFKNAHINNKYLFHDGEHSEKVLSRLSRIDKDSESPFVTTLGNSFRYIEEIN